MDNNLSQIENNHFKLDLNQHEGIIYNGNVLLFPWKTNKQINKVLDNKHQVYDIKYFKE